MVLCIYAKVKQVLSEEMKQKIRKLRAQGETIPSIMRILKLGNDQWRDVQYWYDLKSQRKKVREQVKKWRQKQN